MALRHLIFTAGIGLSLAPFAALADAPQYWFIIASTDGGRIEYVDARSIVDGATPLQRSATVVSVHEGPETSPAGAVKWDKITFQYDCGAAKYRIGAIESFTKDGASAPAGAAPSQTWSDNSTNAVVASEEVFVCADWGTRLKHYAPIADDPVANADSVYAVFSRR